MSLPENFLKRFFYNISTSLMASVSVIFLSIYYATLKIEVKGQVNLLMLKLRKENFIVATDGTKLKFPVDALCVHGDSESSISVISQLRKLVDSYEN